MDIVSGQLGTEIDMSKLFFGLANDILCRVAFGKRFMGEKNRLVEVLSETQSLLGGFNVGDFYPEWEWISSLSGFKRRLKRNLDDLRAVCDEIIEEHVIRTKSEDGSANISGKEDFVDVLLRVQKQEDLEVPITDDNLKALVLVHLCLSSSLTHIFMDSTLY